MGIPNDIRELINLWPRRKDLVDDLREIAPDTSISIHQVNKWAETGRINAKFHFCVIRAGERRGFPVDADLLVRLHAPKGLAA